MSATLRITERLRSRTPFFSLEFFPPKTDAGGAPRVHFYTLNKSPATRAVVSALRAVGGASISRIVPVQ